MVFVLASLANSPNKPNSNNNNNRENNNTNGDDPIPSQPNNVLRSTTSLINFPLYNKQNRHQSSSNESNPTPLSLTFLHKKRHSDPTIETDLPQEHDNDYPDSPPRLIRKKSGELVKSSLKLDSLANKAKSMPTTPTYKNVHFGNDVDVRYFNERDRPTAVSATTSPVLKTAKFLKRKDHIGKGATFEFNQFDKSFANFTKGFYDNDFIDDRFDDDDTTDDDDDDDGVVLDDDIDDNVEVLWDLQTINFNKIKYNDKFAQKSKLFLERISLNDEATDIVGLIAVKNLSYHKKIHIRYTFDQWRTVIEIESFFISENTRILKRSGYDRFKFIIPLKKFEFLNIDKVKLLFCIRYRFGNEEIWDNNDFKNYELLLTKTQRNKLNRKSKFRLNDDSTINNKENETPASTFNTNNNNNINTSHSYNNFNIPTTLSSFKEIDSYFNNYELLRSPETPKVLKSNSITDNDDTMSPILNEFNNFNETSKFEFTNPSNDHVSDSLQKMSLLSDNSKVDLLVDSLSPGTSSTLGDEDSSDDKTTRPIKEKKAFVGGKPSINSKSYQELLDSYCFYKGGEPTTVSSYLKDTMDH